MNTTLTKNLNLTRCPRCAGTGLVMGNVPCFLCEGTGELASRIDNVTPAVTPVDAFRAAIGPGLRYFGITGPAIKGFRVKAIVTSLDSVPGSYGAKEITEQQARAFFSSYGLRAEVPVAATV